MSYEIKYSKDYSDKNKTQSIVQCSYHNIKEHWFYTSSLDLSFLDGENAVCIWRIKPKKQ